MKAILLSIFISCSLLANIGPEGFGKFVNHYFVETGTFGGDSIRKALNAGFQEVRSIEFDHLLFKNVSDAFKNYDNVKIFHGDSSKDLWDMIKDINKPITFWLDAHIFPPQPGKKNCPLIEELEQIKWHPIKNHIILIDDMHCTASEAFDFITKEDLIQKILEINPDYIITYVVGGEDGEYKDNVMVAYVP